jgi:hypothetical protein
VGTRALVEVLLLHHHLPGADVVAVEARRIAEQRTQLEHEDAGAAATTQVRRVVSLAERRLADPTATIAALPADTRPLPTVNAYDELLARRREHQPSARPDRSPSGPTTGEVS